MAVSDARGETNLAPVQAEDAVHNLHSDSLLQINNDNNDSSSLVKMNSLGKQSSLLHQSSSYLKHATSGFMRWQSRRAFWSAVDASDAQPKGARVAYSNTRLAVAYWFKTVSAVGRRHPSVFIAPLLLGAALMAGGLCGVIISAQEAEKHSKDDARAAARLTAGALETLVDERGLQPTATLASLARQQPNASALREALPRLETRLLTPQSTAAAVQQLILAPFGKVAAVLRSSSANASGSSNSGGVAPLSEGTDLQSDTSMKSGVAQAIQKKAPVVVVQRSAQGGSPEVLLYSTYPVFVPGVEANETWGNGAESDATDVANCGGACYNASSRTKLWGFTGGVLSLSTLVNGAEGLLRDLEDQGYRYRLRIRTSGARDSSWTDLAESSTAPSEKVQAVSASVRLYGTSAASASEGEAEAELSVYPSAGWQPTWEGPLIAVVIIVSLALMVLLFAVLLNYWRHMLLLKAILPEKVISVLGRGAHYYQHFDCVTVLYADVVRYTTGKVQHGDGAPTLEVVKLLNDVHSMYESIIERYGLVRIRRSGESFMCVGGCPIPDDPVTVAVRVASCARDLVLATSRFRGSSGFRVQIRLGLHTGPVVAAVVGSKMPRFSLFGDIVDVAYYMEATSRAMAIHVSDLTSQLLATANDPLLQLRPRGRLEIIGQGTMFTNWLKVEALPEPTAAPGEEDASKEKKVAVVVEGALKPGK